MLTNILLSVLLLLAAEPSTQPAGGATDKATIRAVIDDFLKSPANDHRARQIMKFAQDSDDVLISLDSMVVNWMRHQPKYEQADMLLAVFVAGNVRSQLESGKVADDSYAGLQEVFRVYRDLQQKQSALKIPEIESLIEKDKAGTLKSFIAERAASHERAPGTQPAGR
jgi:hypothetical protein